jgi:hypothetical protein
MSDERSGMEWNDRREGGVRDVWRERWVVRGVEWIWNLIY